MLSSLLLPAADTGEEDGGSSIIDAGDTRFAAMGIISFIPYFNWLSWVFAWLDSGKRRYAVYSIVYLVPYLSKIMFISLCLPLQRTMNWNACKLLPDYLLCLFLSNFSLSREDSWLPIASILFCIVHVQLEASIRNGDLQGFQIFSEAAKHLSSRSREEDEHFKGYNEPKKGEHRNLPDAEEHSRNEIPHWGIPKRPSQHHEQLNDLEDDGKKHAKHEYRKEAKIGADRKGGRRVNMVDTWMWN
ncbi:hypothetical protein GOBAR_AA03563 [Gossypium barbadense]|uniref:Uncharacterized protein n=1 Tax=Gossypium barbadense TaxID=3634 RepID=A0A2P5YN74_GOSBA|nr:hypothetical protein GOBAR_AA03563 [Gossypium barbadense]